METIIFDMYGVIIKDPEGGLMPFVNQTFPELGTDDVYKYWKKAYIGELSSIDFFRSVGFDCDLKKLEKDYLDTIEVNEDFYRVASILKKEFRLALLSNDISEWNLYLRHKFDIEKFFDVIVVSGDVRLKKPDKDIFEFTLEKLKQTAPECTYIDDRRKNLSVAESLGINTILFNTRKVDFKGRVVNDFNELLNSFMPYPRTK